MTVPLDLTTIERTFHEFRSIICKEALVELEQAHWGVRALTLINNKPRKILGYKSSLQVAKEKGLILE